MSEQEIDKLTSIYSRKVRAVRLSAENVGKIADWCCGDVQTDGYRGSVLTFPKRNGSTWHAWIGDWIIQDGDEFRRCKPDVFAATYEQAESKCGSTETWKTRFINEYSELTSSTRKLEDMLDHMTKGDLDFTPNCSYALLSAQYCAMHTYLAILAERARIENIPIPEC